MTTTVEFLPERGTRRPRSQSRSRLLRLVGMLILGVGSVGCRDKAADSAATGAAGSYAAPATVSGDVVVQVVDPQLLSLAIDAGRVVGLPVEAGPGADPAEDPTEADRGPFDFDRPALRPLVAALAPAMVRVGGTDADHLWYDPSGDTPAVPDGFRGVVDASTWDALTRFARDTGTEVFFTLNAGPSVRDAEGVWSADNAASLMAFAADRDDPIAAWELGDELNAFPLEHGVQVPAEQYAADLASLGAVRDATTPGVPVAGPSVAYSPVNGEVVPYLDGALAAAGTALDVVTWHYHPQQAEDCPVQSRPAAPEVMLDPVHLDEVALWAEAVEALAALHVPHADVWLGETANARCGGAAGVSDTWASSFWFLDQLGLLARRGQPRMVRQGLAGGADGMLDGATLQPRPDYWAALLWRTTMGDRVLEAVSGDPALRIYAHCHPQGDGAVSVLAINLDAERTVDVGVAGLSSRNMRVHVLEADALDSVELRYNGEPLVFGDDLVVPTLEGEIATGLVLAPLSIGVAVLPEAAAPACRD